MESVKFKTNINCGNCIKSVTPHLNDLEDVDYWKVDTDNPDKILEVTFDEKANESEVIKAVQKAGFNIEKI